MIRAEMTFVGQNAKTIGRSLEPDNLPEMSLCVKEDAFIIAFSVEKIGTLLSTADDLLMNIKIAEETLITAEDR